MEDTSAHQEFASSCRLEFSSLSSLSGVKFSAIFVGIGGVYPINGGLLLALFPDSWNPLMVCLGNSAS